MEKYKEILRLKDMLEKAGIPFKFEHSFDGYHICYPKAGEERVCSVVEHWGSYGHDKDLLEAMDIKDALEKTRAKGQPKDSDCPHADNITHDTAEVKSIAELWRTIKSA